MMPNQAKKDKKDDVTWLIIKLLFVLGWNGRMWLKEFQSFHCTDLSEPPRISFYCWALMMPFGPVPQKMDGKGRRSGFLLGSSAYSQGFGSGGCVLNMSFVANNITQYHLSPIFFWLFGLVRYEAGLLLEQKRQGGGNGWRENFGGVSSDQLCSSRLGIDIHPTLRSWYLRMRWAGSLKSMSSMVERCSRYRGM